MCSCVCCDVERSAEAAAGRLVVPTRCQVAGSGTARGSVLTEAELQISGPLCTDNIFMFTTSYNNCFVVSFPGRHSRVYACGCGFALFILGLACPAVSNWCPQHLARRGLQCIPRPSQRVGSRLWDSILQCLFVIRLYCFFYMRGVYV